MDTRSHDLIEFLRLYKEKTGNVCQCTDDNREEVFVFDGALVFTFDETTQKFWLFASDRHQSNVGNVGIFSLQEMIGLLDNLLAAYQIEFKRDY